MAVTQKNRPIQVITPLGEDILLFYRMNGVERLSEPFEYELELLSENAAIEAEKLLGENITLGMVLADGSGRYFNGYVTRFGQYGTLDVYAYYRATVRPWLWFLTRASNCRIFQQKTAPDIIKQVFRDQGFSDFKEKLSGQYASREYCVQYRETDFNFVSRLMEEEGIYYYFTHENGKHHLVLADSGTAHDQFPGYGTIPYHVEEGSTDRSRTDHIHDWGFTREVQTGAYALTDYDFKKPKADLMVKSAVQKRHAHSGYEFFDYPGLYNETGTGDHFVRHRIEEHHARYERCDGKGNARGLATGYLFSLVEYPRKDQNREYLITSAVYRMQMDAYLSTASSAGSGETFTCSFTSADKTQPYRPPRLTPKPLIHGAQTAIVVGPSGEEIYTDKFGRVKVQFHWDRYAKGDENSSCWVRISQPWAGKNWGMLALPRIGQEVIVDFLEGDPDQPIITGRVYNAAALPPYQLPDNANLTTLKTNSTKGGGGFNEIRFDDKKGKEQVFIHAERNQDIRVKKDLFEWIGNERHLIVQKDLFEQVEGDKHSTVKGDHNAAVKGTVSIKADQDLQQKVGLKHALDAGQEIHLKAGMKVIIEAGLNLTLKAGSNFIVIDSTSGVSISGMPAVMINSGGSAGSGSGANPDAAKPPKEAAKADPGQVDEAKPAAKPPKPKTYGPSAMVLKLAAKDGTPFCEQCEAARRAAESNPSS
ncbi:MAG: type VI secretion system tip protein TssI/VgrG [Methylococcaceae bacterium]|nr:type VI secretion system tip protein TssI/VgrG [Methylococcaceae bacterium]